MMSLMFAAIALFFAAASFYFAFNVNKQNKAALSKVVELTQQLELTKQSISGLTSGAIGVDSRLRRIEAQEKVLAERQDTYENQQAGEQPYGDAIRLVQQGASADRLIDELEISASEADLIVRLHGEG